MSHGAYIKGEEDWLAYLHAINLKDTQERGERCPWCGAVYAPKFPSGNLYTGMKVLGLSWWDYWFEHCESETHRDELAMMELTGDKRRFDGDQR